MAWRPAALQHGLVLLCLHLLRIWSTDANTFALLHPYALRIAAVICGAMHKAEGGAVIFGEVTSLLFTHGGAQ